MSSGWIGGFHNTLRFDYTADGFKKQLDASLQRMGLGYVDSLVIHDLEPTFHITDDDDGTSDSLPCSAVARIHYC